MSDLPLKKFFISFLFFSNAFFVFSASSKAKIARAISARDDSRIFQLVRGGQTLSPEHKELLKGKAFLDHLDSYHTNQALINQSNQPLSYNALLRIIDLYQELRFHLETQNNLATLAEFLKQPSPNPRWKYNDGVTLWELVCRHEGPKDIVLQHRRAAVNLPFVSGLTAVEEAAQKGKSENVFFFFRHQANPGLSVGQARDNGHDELAQKIEEFLEEKERQKTKLRQGIESLNCEIVTTALSYGLDINEVLCSTKGFAALHLALFSCDFSSGDEDKKIKSEALLDLILHHKPFFEHKDKEGLTAINFALKYKKEAAEILLEEARSFREIDEADSTGMAPVHYAACGGSFELWYNLKRKKANIYLQAALQWDVFDFAAAHDNTDIIVDLIDIHSWSFDPGKFLAGNYSLEVKKIIIERVTIEDLYKTIDERYLLKKYTLEGSTELLEALHARGVIFERPQEKGLRALHYAVRERNIAMARWLLEHGAKAYPRDEAKVRPFQLISCEESPAWEGVQPEVIAEWEQLFKPYPRNGLVAFFKRPARK